MATEEESNESTINALGKNDRATTDGHGAVTVNGSSAAETKSGNTENTKLGDNQYFFEDEVFYIDKFGRVKFGLVIETCDSYSSEEEDDDDEEVLSRGYVRVAWYPHGREHVRSENTIGLADRTLMPGDVVRRMTPGCNPQRGYVRDIKITADVKILGVPYVIKNVAAERLRPLNIWQRDCTVCLDSWVGSAKDVDERAVLRGVNGVRFEISSSDYFHFKEASTSRRPSVFSPPMVFPGNMVIGKLPSLDKAKVLTPDIPIPVSRKGAMLKSKFVVESVRTEGVIVQWQCKALSKNSSKKVNELELPKQYVAAYQLDRVKRLNVFESCVLQIADRNYLTFQATDKLIFKHKWEEDIATKFKEMFREQQRVEGGAGGGGKKKSSKSSKVNAKSSLDGSKVEKCTKAKSGNPNPDAPPNNAETDWTDVTTSAGTTDGTDVSDDAESVQECSGELSEQESVSTIVEAAPVKENGSVPPASSSMKKPLVTKNLLKKPITVRHKPLFHGKQSFLTKWMQRCPFVTPLNKIGIVPEGTEMITETLLVYSTASVVWQDGTVENDIPSTHLYPIHHLDNHEFFPGDFTMLSSYDPNVTFRDYGVIQTVDHEGRTAKVKWFQTYTLKEDESQAGGENFAPIYKGESEVSVYDLKDHPDFTYRPGGMVIRVSNFVGDEASSTAGQVLDNCTDGRVKVAWINGHTSCCWPQDLFDVGHHEQNDYAGDSDSWETQSENSGLGIEEDDDDDEMEKEIASCTENNIVFFIERTRSAIASLEDILKQNPQLQRGCNISNKLLSIYKTCRKMDHLMQTSFFEEEKFMGFVERIISEAVATTPSSQLIPPIPMEESTNPREKATQTPELIEDIFKESEASSNGGVVVLDASGTTEHQCEEVDLGSETTSSKKVIVNVGVRISSNSSIITSSPGKTTSNSNTTPPARHGRNPPFITHVLHVRNDSSYSQMTSAEAPKSLFSFLPASELEKFLEDKNKDGMIALPPSSTSSSQAENSTAEVNHLVSCASLSIERAFRIAKSMKSSAEAILLQYDSGNFSTNSSDASNNAVESDDTPPLEESPTKQDKNTSTASKSSSASTKKAKPATNTFDVINHIELTDQFPSHLVCLPFCGLLKDQLQQFKNDFELQCGRLSTYKALAVPPNVPESPSNTTTTPDNGNDEKSESAENEKSETPHAPKPTPTTTPDQVEGAEGGGTTNNKGSQPIETDAKEEGDIGSQADVSLNAAAAENWIVPEECFTILSNAPKSHKFYSSTCEPSQPQLYFRAVQREHRLLKSSLPKGIWIRFYEDRIDLLSVMMEGPKKTPYENGLYFFDMQLNQDYPKRPPTCYYISYCVDRLNPNLYEEGKVCVSLLGTWSGRDVEIWGANSTLLQVLVSIQGLILVPEPYFNEAGYEKQKGSQQGHENSRMYNEMVIIKVTQATIKMLANMPAIFLEEIIEYYKQNGSTMYERLKVWLETSKANLQGQKIAIPAHLRPEFPLLPASRGFCLTLEGLLSRFLESIDRAVAPRAETTTTTNTTENGVVVESSKAEKTIENDSKES